MLHRGDNRGAYVVLGYGCHITPQVGAFLDAAATDIAREVNHGRGAGALLITSGGFTMEKSAPGVSEARLFADYLGSRGLELEVVLDEQARTTLENLRGLRRIAAERGIAAEQIVICCDRVRRAKIAHVARQLLGAEPELWLYDLGRTPRQAWLQRTLGLAFDALALRVGLVEKIGLAVIDARNARA